MSRRLLKAVSEAAALTLSSPVERVQFLHSWMWTLGVSLPPKCWFCCKFAPVHYMQFYMWLLTKTAPLVSSVRFRIQTLTLLNSISFLQVPEFSHAFLLLQCLAVINSLLLPPFPVKGGQSLDFKVYILPVPYVAECQKLQRTAKAGNSGTSIRYRW